MNKLAFVFFAFFSLATSVWAGSVHLVNDSPYTLRAEVRGADGTFLGEMVLKPEHSIRWTDTYGRVGHFGKGNVYQEQSSRSQTPYQVRWTCMNGRDFSYCNGVATGGTATARTCEGRRICDSDDKERSEEQK